MAGSGWVGDTEWGFALHAEGLDRKTGKDVLPAVLYCRERDGGRDLEEKRKG